VTAELIGRHVKGLFVGHCFLGHRSPGKLSRN
jgi:hypothetical protein